MKLANVIGSITILYSGVYATVVAAQGTTDCKQIISGTEPFQIEFSDGTLSEVVRREDGLTVVLNGGKGRREAQTRHLFYNGYLVQHEAKGSRMILSHSGDPSQNPYLARKNFVANPTRTELKDGVTRQIALGSSAYDYVQDGQKLIGSCLVKTIVFQSRLSGRCGDREMPPVIHHHAPDLRVTVSSSGHACRNGEHVPFARDAVTIRTDAPALEFTP